MPLTRPVGEQLRFESARTGSHILDAYLEAAEMGGRTLADLLEQLFNPTTGDIEPFEMRIQNNVLEFRTAGTTVFVPVVSYQAFYDGLQTMLSQATTYRNQALQYRNEAETFRNQASTSATSATSSATSAAQSAALAASFTPTNIQADLDQSFDLALMYDFDPPVSMEERYKLPEVILHSPTYLQTTDAFNNKMGRVVLTYSEGVTRGTGAATLNIKSGSNWVLVETVPASRITTDGIYVTLRMPPLQRASEYQIVLAADFVRDEDGNRSAASSTYSFITT